MGGTEEPSMIGLYVLLGGIVLFSGVVVFLDWLGQRRERTARATESSPQHAPSLAAGRLRFRVTLSRTESGQWSAEIADLPILALGATREEALANVEALALRVIADRIQTGGISTDPVNVSFEAA